VVVAVGVTVCVPPPGCKACVLPSDPDTVTCVALVAVTVKVDEPPAATEVGFAEIPTDGATDERLLLLLHPANRTLIQRPDNIPDKVQRRDRRILTLVNMLSFLLFERGAVYFDELRKSDLSMRP